MEIDEFFERYLKDYQKKIRIMDTNVLQGMPAAEAKLQFYIDNFPTVFEYYEDS
jgi:hypothetical protein